MPGHESSQVRRAQSARSYDGIAHPANPTAARRSWPRWSSTRSPIISPALCDRGSPSSDLIQEIFQQGSIHISPGNCVRLGAADLDVDVRSSLDDL